MCGIFGYLGTLDADVAARCVDRLRHRGPDGRGTWHGPGIVLGHRRLAILDRTSLGRQPMSYADGRLWITYNGEIYNFLELRAELEASGYTFRGHSDTEVVLAAFLRWGEDCQFKFNGMWAFAIWDDRERTLFASRDRFGLKPLYYAELPNGDFAFASEMKALLPLLAQPSPDVDMVRCMSIRRSFAYEATPRCIVRGLRRLPPGHCLRVRRGHATVRRWWNTLDHLPDVSARYEEQAEQLRGLLLDSCRLRLRSDVPIGTALSGGLDSSAVLSAMAHAPRALATDHRSSRDWQHAFVASFPGTPLDETHYALRTARFAGVVPRVLPIDPTRYLDQLPRMLYYLEELSITPPIPFMALYQSMRAAGVSVTLDGHGADELFGGYPLDLGHALLDAQGDLRAVHEMVGLHAASSPSHREQFPPRRSGVTSYLRQVLSAVAKEGLRWLGNPPKEFTSHDRWKRMDHLGRALFWQTHQTTLPTLLRNYDRYGMANGVEIRMPFLDWRVVTFAFALPWSAKIRNGYSKRILRDAMASLLPPAVAYRRTKIGFGSPIVDWMRGPLRTYVLDTLGSQEFRQSSLVDARRARACVDRVIEHPRPTFRHGEQAWWSVAPYLWWQAMREGAVA